MKHIKETSRSPWHTNQASDSREVAKKKKRKQNQSPVFETPVSVVFIERRGAETELLYTPCAHVPDITNQSLYLFLMSPYKYLRTVQNRSPTVTADRSELTCPYLLDRELV